MIGRPERRDFTPEDLRGQVGYMVRLIQISAYKRFEKSVTGFGSAPRYFGLLRLVEANPGIAQSRIAEAIHLDRSSLVPIIEALEAEGYVERAPAKDDKRLRLVSLTVTGARRLQALKRLVEDHEATMTAGFSAAEKATLLDMLQRIDGNLRGAGQSVVPVEGELP